MNDVSPFPRVLGAYELIRPLARGGMGQLYVAREDGGNIDVEIVLKLMTAHATHQHSRDRIRMFLDEARIATLLRHPNIVEVYSVDYDKGYYFMVMEWLKGWDLRTVAEAFSNKGELIPIPMLTTLILDAARGLHCAHECQTERGEPLNLVHRDVTPSNLFVSTDGVLKLLDFGVAKTTIQVSSTQIGTIKGKLSYLSPEQARGQPLDRRSDLFSLGVVLHELITGQRLFPSSGLADLLDTFDAGFIPPALRPDGSSPQELVQLTNRLLQPHRDLRPPSALGFIEEMEAIAAQTGKASREEIRDQIASRLDPEASVVDSSTDGIHNPERLERWADTISRALESAKAVDSTNSPRLFDVQDTVLIQPKTGTLDERAPVGLTAATQTLVSEPPQSDGNAPSEDRSVGKSPDENLALSHTAQPSTRTQIGRWSRSYLLLTGVLATFVIALAVVVGSQRDASSWASETKHPDEAVSAAPTSTVERTPDAEGPIRLDASATADKAEFDANAVPNTKVRRAAPPQRIKRPGLGKRQPSSETKLARNLTTSGADKPIIGEPASQDGQNTGRLTLVTEPWAKVFLGKRLLGETPLVNFELPVGTQTLRLVNHEFGINKVLRLEIPADDVLRKKLTLR